MIQRSDLVRKAMSCVLIEVELIMAKMTKPAADAVCTMIALGYVEDNGKQAKAMQTNFEYADDKDKADYVDARRRFEATGVDLPIAQSASQATMAYVVAKTPKVSSIGNAARLTDEYWKYLQAITKSANELESAPYGAYIGGMSTTSTLFIVGPSALDQYTPVFRGFAGDDLGNVKTSYAKAKTAINDALKCLNKDQKAKPTGIKVEYADMGQEVTSDLAPGKLFCSYHGMIQAMVKYGTTIDTQSFIFEIALGKNTSKVSSCLACSLFMTANGTPATSTHLGRGDNWNIPPKCSMAMRKNWEDKIKTWYMAGKKRFFAKQQGMSLDDANFLNSLKEQDIPAVFLEALTFEGKFTDKIRATLPDKKQPSP